ncbi:MAG: aminotransferase class I/II-fold pyridoxal phosphate-dependent enzyme [Ruminococcaceae bacterium]|nr:aminotransferase class I/II-fold pyridoxal phosphate-dependent enzyme [Oscillospiraceae bacterium]
MISFASDYLEGAHEAILRRLAETNYEKLSGYGSDPYCESAASKIKAACQAPEADVRFLVGGTQTNQIVIAAMLSEGDGVIAADTGHIAGHEAGAIEYTGHKVLTLPHHEGKLDAEELAAYLAVYFADENREHMVLPAMVYLSHPTEYGTLYRKEELTAIASVCRRYGMPLFLDGARLGYGLMSYDTDLTLPDIAALCDVFYIGGTKVGALCGEAVVFPRGNTPKRFLSTVKRHGALLAKGRLLGIQFDVLFTDGLYFSISRHAIDMAEKLKAIFREKGYAFHIDSPTNQIFVILENEVMEQLREKVSFSFWERLDEHRTVVRFATGWATTEEDLAALEALL